MAKGNDGNYLQHSVEVEAASRLARIGGDGRLHIAMTHGMAPFEPFGGKAGQVRGNLDAALTASREPSLPGDSAIVAAYRETGASADNYPNSAELLRSAIGAGKLSGGITEIDPTKCDQLSDAWAGSRVVPRCSSWRREMDAGGILACPESLQAPWLFTMDPMTYTEGNAAGDDKLHRADIHLLSATLGRYIKSGQPGIAAFFVYAMWRERGRFWNFIDELQDLIGAVSVSFWLTHRGGSQNLAALLCSGTELPPAFAPAGVNAGRT